MSRYILQNKTYKTFDLSFSEVDYKPFFSKDKFWSLIIFSNFNNLLIALCLLRNSPGKPNKMSKKRTCLHFVNLMRVKHFANLIDYQFYISIHMDRIIKAWSCLRINSWLIWLPFSQTLSSLVVQINVFKSQFLSSDNCRSVVRKV